MCKAMRSQKEKMLSGELYDPLYPQLSAERRRDRILFKALDDTRDDQQDERAPLIRELIPDAGEGVWIEINHRSRCVMISRRFYPAAWFLPMAAALYAFCILSLHSQAFALRPDLISGAVTFDFTVSVPFLYWWFMVRKARWPALSILPVLVLCLLIASLLLPAEHRQPLRLAQYLVVFAELAALAAVTAKAVGATRAYRSRVQAGGGDDDPVELLRFSLRQALPVERVADVVADELALLYYALFSWRRRVTPRADEVAFSYHRESGYGSLLLTFTFVAAMELVGAHFLVSAWWGHRAAWVLTGLSLYGLVWLLGFYQAVRLRPVTVGSDSLRVRVGLRWSVRVPFDQIEAVLQPAADQAHQRGGDYLRAVALGEPQFILRLREPLTAHGLYGTSRRVRSALPSMTRSDLRMC